MQFNAMSNDRIYKMSKDELVHEIVRIITSNTDDKTDGECIDQIMALLNNEGYSIDWEPF